MTTEKNYVDLDALGIASSPGDAIAELLEEQGRTTQEFVDQVGFSESYVNEILSGEAALTPEFAVALERVFKVPSRFWVRLDSNYREVLDRVPRDGSSVL